MLHRTITYVAASDLFAKHPNLLEEYIDSEPAFVWGTNEHSMGMIGFVLGDMDASGLDIPDDFREICDSLGEDQLVDFET